MRTLSKDFLSTFIPLCTTRECNLFVSEIQFTFSDNPLNLGSWRKGVSTAPSKPLQRHISREGVGELVEIVKQSRFYTSRDPTKFLHCSNTIVLRWLTGPGYKRKWSAWIPRTSPPTMIVKGRKFILANLFMFAVTT